MIYIPCGYTSCNSNIENKEEWIIKKFPSIYKYLVKTEMNLSKERSKNIKGLYNRTDQGEFWWELRSCNYMDDFNKPKIVWTAVNSEYKFALLPKNMLINNSLFMITGKNIEYLCAILNSKLFRYYMYLTINNGSYTYGSKELIENIFIKEVSNDIVNLINKYLINKEYEKIDTIVFKIYSINEKEINYINSKIK